MTDTINNTTLKIYIAGPYTAPTAEGRQHNVNIAIDVALRLWKRGHFPYVPHLTHYIDERAVETGVPMAYEEYLAWDNEWLKACDAILYLAPSRGADIELGEAKRLGKRVYYSEHEIGDPEISAEP
jgi:hypothetical protein